MAITTKGFSAVRSVRLILAIYLRHTILSSAAMMLGVLGTSIAPLAANATTVDNTQQASAANIQGYDTGQWGSSSYSIQNGIAIIYFGELSGPAPAAIRECSTIIITPGVIAPDNSAKLFSDLSAKEISGLNNLDTSKVTNMYRMFANDVNIRSLNLSGFNTDKVTNMEEMFYDSAQLRNLDVSHFVTHNLRHVTRMFANTHITYLDLTEFDTSEVVSMVEMFAGTPWLSKIDGLYNFSTTNVTDMREMFMACGVQSLDLSSFNTHRVQDMHEMLNGTGHLQKLILGHNVAKITDVQLLNKIPNNTQYTGKWQNVGNGTVDHPNGKNVWTSDEFMANYDGSKDADTYVWQPKSSLLNSIGSN